MYLIYSSLLTVGFLFLLPRFAIDALRSGKYITGLDERLGRLPKLSATGGPLIWLHCVSVGETEAARSLVRTLRQTLPEFRLVVSTTTVTGQQVARRIFADEAALVFFFPIDWIWTVRRVLNAIHPSAILLMETEIWPNLLRECGRRSIPIALINGRISPTSFRRYSWIRGFMRRTLKDLSVAVMQSESDAQRITDLGIDERRVTVAGNLKFDSASSSSADDQRASEIRQRFGFDSARPVIVAASTHSPEESIVLEAFKQIRKSNDAPRLILVPRHPERFEEVATQVADSGFPWSRRSAPGSANDQTAAIVLLDSIGELRAVYQLADIAFIGGSLIPHGGQNPLEPAAQAVCLITGTYTQNFAAITRKLLENDALIQLPNLSLTEAPAALARLISELLGDDERRRTIGQRAHDVCVQNGGATQRTVETIINLLGLPASTAAPAPLPTAQLSAVK